MRNYEKNRFTLRYSHFEKQKNAQKWAFCLIESDNGKTKGPGIAPVLLALFEVQLALEYWSGLGANRRIT